MELVKGRLVDYLPSVRFLFISASQVGSQVGRLVDYSLSVRFHYISVSKA